MSLAAFKKYAEYYDVLYKDKDYLGEAKFITSLLSSCISTRSEILELGSGTGHHAALLAEQGWIIDGIDLSDEMILAANTRKKNLAKEIADRLSFSNGDVRDFSIGKQYDAIISLFHVVSYQNSNDDILRMFKKVKEHLKPGGFFIFDYWYGPAVLTETPQVRVKRMKSSEVEVTRIAEPVLHPNTSLVDVNYEIQVRDMGSHEVEILRESHTMRYFFLNEIDLLLQQVGLRSIRSLEWLTGNPPGINTWGVCTVAIN